MKSKKKEKADDQVFTNKVLLIIIAIPLLSAIFTYMFSYFFQFPKSILVGTIDGWLGFTGGVIGGTLTVFGVILTLREQNKLRDLDEQRRDKEKKEEDQKKYLPYFSLSYTNKNICSFNDIPKFDLIHIFDFDNYEKYKLQNDSNLDRTSIVYVQVKNVSLNPAMNLKFIGNKLSISNVATGENILNKVENINASASFIPSNNYIAIGIHIPDIRGIETILVQLLFDLYYDSNLGYHYHQPGNLMISVNFEIDIIDDFKTKFNPNKIQLFHDMSAPILIPEETEAK
jgi:hypothetical protein